MSSRMPGAFLVLQHSSGRLQASTIAAKIGQTIRDIMGLFSRAPKINYLPSATDSMAVAGTSFRQAGIPSPGVYPFQLIADQSNEADKHAVAVFYGKAHVGFVPAADASHWSRLTRRLAKEGTAVWVQGEVRQGDSGRWILLTVPPVEQVRAWLKG